MFHHMPVLQQDTKHLKATCRKSPESAETSLGRALGISGPYTQTSALLCKNAHLVPTVRRYISSNSKDTYIPEDEIYALFRQESINIMSPDATCLGVMAGILSR